MAPSPITKLTIAFVISTATVLAHPGLAEEMILRRATEAASLHAGPLDMVAYYVPTPGGALEVTATFVVRDGPAGPRRIVMALGQGDDVAFAMPGYPEAVYRFARDGAMVRVSVRPDAGPARRAGL